VTDMETFENIADRNPIPAVFRAGLRRTYETSRRATVATTGGTVGRVTTSCCWSARFVSQASNQVSSNHGLQAGRFAYLSYL
jgi:hypothetical protein